MYENVHPKLTLVLLFVRAEVECGKGLLRYITFLGLALDICLPKLYVPRSEQFSESVARGKL